MKWRVTIELSEVDGTKQTHEVAQGGCADPHSTLDTLGLTLDDGKALLAGGKRKPLATVDAVFELAWNSVTLG